MIQHSERDAFVQRQTPPNIRVSLVPHPTPRTSKSKPGNLPRSSAARETTLLTKSESG